jgi:hypothetical protein
MIREEQSRKNNELMALFMQQVLDDPELLEAIPEGAEVIFLPQNDADLCDANLELGKARQAEGRQVAYISIELVPQVKTFFVPRLRLAQIPA